MFFILLGFIYCGLVDLALADSLTLPQCQRPEWLQREGIVMAGSWEPLLFRVRRDGNENYTPTPEQQAAYLREHSPEMIAKLKQLGVNFVMMHCYKGFGLKAEAESMKDAVQFSKLCHDAGLHVGVYTYSGAFGWELFFKEMPEAKDWVVLDPNGKPVTYDSAAYRYYWNRNHPVAQTFYKKIIRFAVQDIHTDLLHFDNYEVGPGWDQNSVQRFRNYLRNTFTSQQLEDLGSKDMNTIIPPKPGAYKNLLDYAWRDFICGSLAESYQDMSRYARTLRKDILLECNPGGIHNRIIPPIDHGRLLVGGEAFWDEGLSPGFRDGILYTRIRTYKVARRMDNMAFAYCTTPLELAESMAFNLDCLGCIGWFEYGNLAIKPGLLDPVTKKVITSYINFYHTHRDLFRNADGIADVAILRSFPSQTYADPKYADITVKIEQALIENRIPFQILYDSQLDNLQRYRILVLAGCVALSNSQITLIKQYLEEGGQICIIGPTAVYDEWMNPRKDSFLQDSTDPRIFRIRVEDDFNAIFLKTYKSQLSLIVEAPLGLCSELTDQKDRRFIHLVNYRSDQVAENVHIQARLPIGKKLKRIQLVNPQRENDIELPFAVKDERVSFTLPGIPIYEIACLQFQ